MKKNIKKQNILENKKSEVNNEQLRKKNNGKIKKIWKTNNEQLNKIIKKTIKH